MYCRHAPTSDRHAELKGAEMILQARCSEEVHAFSCDTPPDITDSNWPDAARLLLKGDEVAAEEDWPYVCLAFSFEQKIGMT